MQEKNWDLIHVHFNWCTIYKVCLCPNKEYKECSCLFLRIQSKIVLAKKLLWINNKQSITKTLNNIILSMQISEYTCIVGKQCTAVWCEQNNMSLKSSCAVDVYLIVI